MKWFTLGRKLRAAHLARAQVAVLALCAWPLVVAADLVQMQNGDQYVGKVVSLSADTLVLQSDVLGTVRLPRSKVAQLSLVTNSPVKVLGVGSSTNAPAQLPLPAANQPSADFSGLLRDLGANTNLIKQVQAQFLTGAGSEAEAKFNELLGGLVNGKLTMNDLTAQAKSAADQLRAARKDLGDDAGWMIDSYIGILDHFLREAAPVTGSSTNQTKAATKRSITEDE